MLELELLLPLRQDGCCSDCAINESMQLAISKARGGYESSFGFWANLLNFRQPASIDTQSVGNRCDALCIVSPAPQNIEAAQLVAWEIQLRYHSKQKQGLV